MRSTAVSLTFAALFLMGMGCSTVGVAGSLHSPSAPPRKCEITVGAWCIFESNITIQHKPSAESGYRSVWTIWGSNWSKQPSIILEPNGCRDGLSDVVRLIEFDGNFPWDGRRWNSILVKLKSDDACNLRLLSPTVEDDPSGAAFSANLSLIRACQTQDCMGPTLGERLWPAVKRE